MSLRDDARDCLIKAIHDRKRLDVTPEQLNDLRPSDPAMGTQDGFAWIKILEATVACMRAKGHGMNDPDQFHAHDLFDEILIESQLYVERLVTTRGRLRLKLSPLQLVGGLAVAAGSIALVVRVFRTSKK